MRAYSRGCFPLSYKLIFMSRFFCILFTDFLQRFRSNTFVIVLFVSVIAAYKFVPKPEDNYTTIQIGDYTGLNNAAWIGHSTAILASFFLWFIGFYVINNSIKRDLQTGVGQIIASTSISNFQYLLAKTLSHFLLLSIIVIVIFSMALSISFFRCGNYTFDLFQFVVPFMFTTIPSIFFLSATFIFFEVIFVTKTNLMNLIYFLTFVVIVSITNLNSEKYLHWIDPMGIKFLLNEIIYSVKSLPTSENTEISVGINYNKNSDIHFFLFEGSNFNLSYYFSRILWVIMAFLLIKLSSFYFHRFDTKATKLSNTRFRYRRSSRYKPKFSKIELENLVKSEDDFGIKPLIKMEFIMLLRKGSLRFWFLNLAFFITLFFLPLETALSIGLPIFWYSQVNRWSDLCTKEHDFRTDAFIYCTYKPLERLLVSQIIAAISLAVFLAIPVIIRLCLAMRFFEAIQIVTGAILLISFSVFSGILFKGKRFFEISFLLITYITVISGRDASYITWSVNSEVHILFQLVLILLFLSLSFWLRKLKLKNV